MSAPVDPVDPADSAETVHELFRTQAARTPDATAVVDGAVRWTYAELDRLSDALAGTLVQLGVGRDRSVGVFMERSADYILACMAALKAGGAYLPLDMAYPDALLGRILEQTGSPVVLTRAALAPRLPAAGPQVLAVDEPAAWRGGALPPDRPPARGEDVAFVVYTSGTTGEPKGIEMPHRGAVHSYAERHREQPYAPGQRVACNVFFVWEFFRPLARGAAVYVIPDGVIYDPRPLAAYLEEHRITEVLFTPSLLETVLNTVPVERLRPALATLEVLYLNGEVVTTRLRERALAALPAACRLLNTYSISECHDVATLDLRRGPVPPSGFCPVGYPIAGVTAHLLDGAQEPVAEGAPGELYVGGPGLARGYLRRPDLTAARFVTVDGERLYRTGDVALRHPDGLLEIRGRCDFMVKIRGYSVHLGAVEAALRKVDGVASAAVLAEGAEGEDKRLVAYVVRAAGASWRADPRTGVCLALRRGLEPLLADFMRPSVFVEIAELPLSATTGKLKLDQLPPPPRRQEAMGPELHLAEGASEASRREGMRAAWARVLGLAPGDVGDDSDFFDLGGHSLLAVELTSLVARVFGAELSVQQVYTHPTVAALVRLLDGPPAPGPEHNLRAQLAPLRADAHLPAEIRPAGPPACASLTDARVVFLTGATGFLGAFLLDELLRETDAEVRFLVRARDAGAAARRLEANLARYQLDLEGHRARVVPVVGDLAREDLGLGPEAFAQLAGEVDFVFHCAALVHYVYPYAKLRGPTVLGTREVLRLAATGRVSPMVHVSTNGIVPEAAGVRVPETGAIDGFEVDLAHGYGQAKWVAEKLVWEAVARGLPVALFRPGNIGHHSRTGAANPNDLQYHLLEACLKLGATPRRPGWAVELTPVDFLVRALVRLARDPAHMGQVFHVVAHPPLSLGAISRALADLDLVHERASPEAWAERLRRAAADQADPVLEILARTLDDLDRALTHANHFERDRFERAAEAVGLRAPPTDRAYLEAFLRRRAAALGELATVGG